jgi:antitoxin protein of toxin-antitoxin system
MSILDKAKGLLSKNNDKAKGGVDKAADVADDKTGGKHTEQIEGAAEKAKDAIDDIAAE